MIPNMRGIAMELTRDHTPPPRKHSGIGGEHVGDRWYPSAIQAIIYNPVY
jgi:hypothetical protein